MLDFSKECLRSFCITSVFVGILLTVHCTCKLPNLLNLCYLPSRRWAEAHTLISLERDLVFTVGACSLLSLTHMSFRPFPSSFLLPFHLSFLFSSLPSTRLSQEIHWYTSDFLRNVKRKQTFLQNQGVSCENLDFQIALKIRELAPSSHLITTSSCSHLITTGEAHSPGSFRLHPSPVLPARRLGGHCVSPALADPACPQHMRSPPWL